jgi:hypothetical protein
MRCRLAAPAALALLLPLAAPGCGGSNDLTDPWLRPAPGSETGLAALALSGGVLSPAFSGGIRSYASTAGLLAEASVGITATPIDAKATLTVNGAPVPGGQRADVALRDGANTIRVAVTAEDGVGVGLTTVAVERRPPNTRVWALNGLGGAPVENTVLTLTDNRGRVLTDGVALPREKNGGLVFGLDTRAKYNIYARGDNSAVACFANFDPAREGSAELYCMRNSTTFYELEAPVIEDISFADANSADAEWRTMPNDARYMGPAAGVAAIRVTALTKNLIAGSTVPSLGEFDIPVAVNLDATASPYVGGVAATAVSRNAPVDAEDGRWYRSVFRCALPGISNALSNKEHFADVVVYDIVGNRTEQRVYLTITDSSSSLPGDADLAGVAPTWDLAQAQTYTGGGDLAGAHPPCGQGYSANAMDPVDGYNGHQQVICQFSVRAGSMNLPIRGFEVWRSQGGQADFVRIATVNYASPAAARAFQYVDRTPSLAAGDAHYRVRAFGGNPANNGYSMFSEDIRAAVLPPTTTGPAASHSMVSDRLWPQFRIAAGNPLMLDGETSDHFYFTLFVKDAAGPNPFLLLPFWVDFTETGVFGFPAGRPTVAYQQVDSMGAYGAYGDWNYASDYDAVKDEYTPFAYLDDDGSIVIDTDSALFREAIDNYVRHAISGNPGATFQPGATYLWNLFGSNGGVYWGSDGPLHWSEQSTNAAYFTRGFNANGYTFQGVSYGSHRDYGHGSPEGWFTLIIAAGAK